MLLLKESCKKLEALQHQYQKTQKEGLSLQRIKSEESLSSENFCSSRQRSKTETKEK